MSDDSEHAVLSASGAPGYMRCYGKIAMESTQPQSSSTFANEGTAAHGLGAFLLSREPNKEITMALLMELPGEMSSGHRAEEFIGQTIIAEGEAFVVDYDFAQNVQAYVDFVREQAGEDGYLQVETKVNYANFLGVPESMAWGTSDAIIVKGDELIVIDLKFGKGVQVYAEGNEQAKLYALGSYNAVCDFMDIERVRWVIAQPRIGDDGWYDEDGCTVAELKLWAKTEAAMAAQHALKLYEQMQACETSGDRDAVIDRIKNELTPGEKQCRFCRAKAICPALTQHVVNTVADGFVDLDDPEKGTLPKTLAAKIDVPSLTHEALGEKMRSLTLIEAWIKDVRSAAEVLLLKGDVVPGFKLVRGKLGNRVWVDEAAAEKTVKRVLGTKNAMTAPKVISPTKVEEFKKAGKISEKQWKALQANITQAEGGISIAPESDRREAITVAPKTEDFPDMAEDAGDLSHLI